MEEHDLHEVARREVERKATHQLAVLGQGRHDVHAYVRMDGSVFRGPFCGGSPEAWDPPPGVPYIHAVYDHRDDTVAVWTAHQAAHQAAALGG